MMVHRFLSVLLAFLGLLYQQTGLCGTKGVALVADSGLVTYRFPIVETPSGWKVDEDAGKSFRMAVFIPKEWISEMRPPLILAMATFVPDERIEMSTHIKNEIEKYKKRRTNFAAKEQESITDHDRNKWRVQVFEYDEGGKRMRDTVAYLDEDDHRLQLVLSVTNETDFGKYSPGFLEWVRSYKNVPDERAKARSQQK